jgi:sugar phosphate isomerase/epimerase
LLDTFCELGIGAIEFSYCHAKGEVAELIDCCGRLGIGVVSVHNFCPHPPGTIRSRAMSEFFLLSSEDETERQRAVEYTIRSIETTANTGAKALILHSGRVEIPTYTKRLIDLYCAGEKDSALYNRLKDRLIERRARFGRSYFERFVKSLEKICPAAQNAGVLLAIENRFYYREIPSLDECAEIMERFRGAPVGYWHDIGHAQVMENLGFWRQEDLLRIGQDRLTGFHIHDVLLCEDHLPLSYGIVDFRRFRDYWQQDVVKVIELSPSHGTASVAKGIAFIRDMMGGMRKIKHEGSLL